MLIILSDIHLTDESTSINVNKEAFKILENEIILNARENKAKEIRIVLLGDIFDFQRTDYWLRKNIAESKRPWGGKLDPVTAMNSNTKEIERQIKEIFNEIIKTDSGEAFLKMINYIAKETGTYTKVTYVVGNHDRVLWNFPSLQNKIRDELKNVTENNKYPERVEFLNVLYAPEYGVKGRHGHEFDENTHGWILHNEVLDEDHPIELFDEKAYRVMAIGEVVTAELMGGIIHRVKNSIDNQSLIKRFMDVNNVRPLVDIIRWLDWFERNSLLSDHEQDQLMKAFKESLEVVINTKFARKWDQITTNIILRGDLIDRLELIYNRIKDADFKDLRRDVRIYEFFDDLVGNSKDKYLEGARKEWEWMDSDELTEIQYIVYGHTHVALTEYFEGKISGKVRMYINTGTYLPLIQRATDRGGFARSLQMTMLFFYRDDEDNGTKVKGPSLDLWRGIKRKIYT